MDFLLYETDGFALKHSFPADFKKLALSRKTGYTHGFKDRISHIFLTKLHSFKRYRFYA